MGGFIHIVKKHFSFWKISLKNTTCIIYTVCSEQNICIQFFKSSKIPSQRKISYPKWSKLYLNQGCRLLFASWRAGNILRAQSAPLVWIGLTDLLKFRGLYISVNYVNPPSKTNIYLVCSDAGSWIKLGVPIVKGGQNLPLPLHWLE